MLHQGTFRVSRMRSNLLAKQIPGPVVVRGGVGKDRVNDYGGLMPDCIGGCGLFRTGYQVMGIPFFGAF